MTAVPSPGSPVTTPAMFTFSPATMTVMSRSNPTRSHPVISTPHGMQVLRRPPRDFYQPFLLVLVDDVGARAPMNGHATDARDVPNDGVARDGVAAARRPCQQVPDAQHLDARGWTLRRLYVVRRGNDCRLFMRRQASLHLGGRNVASAQRNVQRLDVVELESLGGIGLREGLGQPPKRLGQQLVPLFHVGAALQPSEPLANLVVRGRRVHVTQRRVEPVHTGPAGHLAGDDLYRVAVLQRGIQRHEPPVHLRADAPVAQLRVDEVRKVDGRGA